MMETSASQNQAALDNETADSTCIRARNLWLSATDDDDMATVERLYRGVWCSMDSTSGGAGFIRGDGDQRESKKPRLQSNASQEDEARAPCRREKLALILLQSGRTTEADQILSSLGYTCRLAASILNYDDDRTAVSGDNINTDIPCRVYDDFLSDEEREMLHSVFLNPTNSYWTDHKYTVEPPSPYFSYLINLKSETKAPNEKGIHAFVRRLRDFLEPHFPIKCASYCEMWAHNRPHATGHQFHFDSDNEGCTTTIRNPICSCVVYLTDGVGGPSVVTNQRLASRNLASAGWLCPPVTGRLVAFDGKVLHGVVPGKAGVKVNTAPVDHFRRVSVMFAFWRKIRVRNADAEPGTARPLPVEPLWAQQLQKPLGANTHKPPTAAKPITLDHVYESTIDSAPWTRGIGLPGYEQIFQGF